MAEEPALKAIVCDRPGSPESLQLREIEPPRVLDDGVLVRVRAASINTADLFSFTPIAHVGRLLPGRHLPPAVLGRDFAGTVTATGAGVTQFRIGDDVLGSARGAFAEYVCASEGHGIVSKPANVSFEDAAALPVAGSTALQAIRDHGHIEPGQRVLINGASGAVGTFAIQIAKALGGEVTAVCSTGKVTQALSLGADAVIDYTREDFTLGSRLYDLIIDISGSRPWSRCKRVLEPHGKMVIIGVSSQHSPLRILGHITATRFAGAFGSRRAVFFIAKITKEDLTVLAEMLATGRIRPVIDARYPLSEVPAACRRLGEGHSAGKIVIDVSAGR